MKKNMLNQFFNKFLDAITKPLVEWKQTIEEHNAKRKN